MGAVSCTRRIQFCCGHRVTGHENKCARLHGHNYVAFVTCEAEQLDEVGRVIDFSVIKAQVGGFIEDKWDHRFLMWEHDPYLAQMPVVEGSRVIAVPFNPTAENMAEHLLRVVAPQQLEGTGVRCTRVRVWETENCYADAYGDAP